MEKLNQILKFVGPEALDTPFKNLLNEIYEDIRTSSIATLNIYVINDVLSFFATHKYLAEILITHKKVDKAIEHGVEYANSVLGALLNISILPKNPLEQCEFFTDVVDNVRDTLISSQLILCYYHITDN